MGAFALDAAGFPIEFKLNQLNQSDDWWSNQKELITIDPELH